MSKENRRLIQIVLAVAFAAAAVRLAWIYHERHSAGPPPAARQGPALPGSYYVAPRKLHAYDLKSLQELAKQPVWVREGYRYTYYPFRSRLADFKHPAGRLGPLEKLKIREVVKQHGLSAGDPQPLMAVFEKEGKVYAVPVGQVQAGDYSVYADEMFLLDDPHQLYDWPAATWEAIDAHQVKPGMDEIQASFALGVGIPKPSGDLRSKIVVYPDGGNQVVITFRDGRAVEVEGGSK